MVGVRCTAAGEVVSRAVGVVGRVGILKMVGFGQLGR